MNDQAYARAAAAYRASGALVRDPATVASALHRALYSAILSARLADEQNRLDRLTHHVQEACRILTALRIHMNFGAAGAGGVQLAAFYARLQRQIVSTAMLRKGSAAWSNVAAPLQTIIVHFDQVNSRNNSERLVSM